MKQNWTYKKVKEVCDKESSNIVLNKIENNTGDFPLYGASGFVKGINFYHREEPYIGIVKDGSGVGRVNVFPAKSSLVGTMQYILPKKDCSLKYLCYVLQGLKLDKFVTGAAIPHIYFRDYGECTIPVPPLATQSRIVSELDLLQSLIDKQKAQLKEYDTLAQSIFYDMFGDPVENEKGWEVKKLGEITVKYSDGPFGSNLKSEHYQQTGVRVIRLQNIGVNTFIDLDQAYISEDHYGTLSKYSCYPGDIVIGTLGEPNLRACLIPNTIQKAINKADCVLCRVRKDIISNTFLCMVLNEKGFVDTQCQSFSHGQTRTRISAGQLKKSLIPIPPLSLQQSFAAKIESIEKQKAAISKSIAETEKLFEYTMDKYFG